MRIILLILCLFALPAHAGFTLIASHASNNSSSSTTMVFSGNFPSVVAGDLIVAVAGNGDGGATTLSLSDGTSTFTQAATPQGYASANGQISIHYLLASVATGAVTYTLTYGAARTYRSLAIFQFRPSDVVTFGDVVQAQGTGTAISSGNVTATGSDILGVGGAFTYNTSNLSSISPLINGVAADGQANNSYTLGFYRAIGAGFTGAASATLGGSDQWGASFAYFRIGAGGPSSTLMIKRRRH